MTRKRVLFSVATAVSIVLVLIGFVGVELSFAIAWGVLGGIVALSSQVILPDEPWEDAPDIDARPERRSSDIARMAWSINSRTGMAGALITGRVRRVLAHRLQRVGLDTENPDQRAQIDALIGGDVWARLVGRGTTRADIERALEAIARLSPTTEKK